MTKSVVATFYVVFFFN